MPLLIATDEAGYGPRLGPLVIVATAWRLPPQATPESVHQSLSQAVHAAPYGALRIDDSKRLFVRKASKQRAVPQQSTLDLLTDAAASWAGMPLPSVAYLHWLERLAPDDLDGLGRQPWFASLVAPQTAAGTMYPSTPNAEQSIAASRSTDSCSLVTEVHQKLINQWSADGLQLAGIAARVIDAATYNALLDVFDNKAELLSHLTCELALKLWRQHAAAMPKRVWIFSDRHGGRAYYGGLLQHHCPDFNMRVLHESPRRSCYQLSAASDAAGPSPGCEIEWEFTVGGDSFAPVALSSIIAKSTREQLMERFNAYFQAEAASACTTDAASPLRPTAGYAVDAERFLRDIREICTRRSLSAAILIRRR